MKKKSFDFNFSEIEQKNINFRLEIKTKQNLFRENFCSYSIRVFRERIEQIQSSEKLAKIQQQCIKEFCQIDCVH